jgi:hypothetical protein
MTTQTQNRILAIAVIFAFIMGAFAIVLIVRANGDDRGTLADQTLLSCEKTDIRDHGDDGFALLQAAGWKGDYRDHSDFLLYSPACNIPTAPWLEESAYTEVAEDGSADMYLDKDGQVEVVESWPAGTFISDGDWHTCGNADGAENGSTLCNSVAIEVNNG